MVNKNEIIKDEEVMFLLFNYKGGVGKSTLDVLLIEWLNFNGKKVRLTDVDGRQTSQKWANACLERGRKVVVSPSEKDYDYDIVDTAGIEGSASPFLPKAKNIIIPFRPHFADVDATLDALDGMGIDWKGKVILVPNFVQSNKYHLEGIDDIIKMNEEENWGCKITQPLRNRSELYGRLLEGSDKNFFSSNKPNEISKKAKEASDLMKEIFEIARIKL